MTSIDVVSDAALNFSRGDVLVIDDHTGKPMRRRVARVDSAHTITLMSRWQNLGWWLTRGIWLWIRGRARRLVGRR